MILKIAKKMGPSLGALEHRLLRRRCFRLDEREREIVAVGGGGARAWRAQRNRDCDGANEENRMTNDDAKSRHDYLRE